MRIESRPAKVAKNWSGHNIHSEPEGGDEGGDAGELLSARDVRFTGIMLDKQQFEELVGEQAYNSFFNQGKNPHEPAYTSFSTLWLDTVYKDCPATIVFGVAATEIEIKIGMAKNISVKPKLSGVAELAFTLIGVFPRSLATLDFERFAGKDVTLSIDFRGKNLAAVQEDQAELPLDQPNHSEGTPIDKKRGRRSGGQDAAAGAH